MNPLNTLAWWQWALLAAVPLGIIALYFLKLRRRPVEVPSTYLWSRTLEDLHVNSIWQRLRRNLLLLLQLLVIALVALALLRPGWTGAQLTDSRFIFLIDTSGSMQATDEEPSRIETAKRQVADLIDRMKPTDVAMLLTSSDFARVEQPYTDNHRLLKQRLADIQATSRPSDLEEALRYAEGLANPGRSSPEATDVQAAEPMPATIYVLSDGGYSTVPNFFLGNLTPVYQPIGLPAAENVAILAFSAERNPEKPTQTQAYARLQNFGTTDRTVQLSLLHDGRTVDAYEENIAAQDYKGMEFDLRDISDGVLALRIDSPDDLALDNVAYAILNPPRPARVLLVTPGNDSLQLCLTTEEAQKVADVSLSEPDYLQSDEYRQRADSGEYDLVIYDRCAPEKMPLASTLFIAAKPPVEGWQLGEPQGPPFIVDMDRVHPIMQLVELGNVRILSGRPVTAPQGGHTLIDSDVGSMLAIAPRSSFEDAVLGFEIVAQQEGQTVVNTNWPIRRSYPVFFMNVVRYLGGGRNVLSLPSVAPGRAVTLQSAGPVELLTVRTPQGERIEVLPEQGTTFVFTRTEDIGVYEVFEGESDQPTQRFAVNLFSARESDIEPEAEIKLQHDTIAATRGVQTVRREVWKWLLFGALGILVFEWYVYNRRVYL